MIARETQQACNWCWAACLRMAASMFGVAAPAQCTLASQFLPGATACCSKLKNDACDQGLDARAVPALYAAVGLVADALTSSGAGTSEQSVRMAASTGVALLMLDVGTGFHFVLVDAIDGPTFEIADPKFPDAVTTDWDTVSSAYGNGNIAQAWRVHARPSAAGTEVRVTP